MTHHLFHGGVRARVHLIHTAAPLVLLVVVLLLGGCAPAGGSPSGGDASPSERPTRPIGPIETVPPEGSGVVGEVPETILEAILEDAARLTDVPVDGLTVVRAEAVTWSDGSLGCPEPGMMYTQALVEGYHVVVDANDLELDYRIGEGGSFRLCEQGTPTGT